MGFHLQTLTTSERVLCPSAWVQIVDVHCTRAVHAKATGTGVACTDSVVTMVLSSGHVLNLVLAVKGLCDLTDNLEQGSPGY